jgi:curved DNA-binding protein
MEYQDYYDILGVRRDADRDEIRKAYRKLAREYHPDANPDDPTAEDRFKRINEAYEVLSDEEKRQKYNKFGKAWEKYERTGGQPGGFDWSQWGGQPGSGSYRTASAGDYEQMFGGGNFSDFFETLFGGGRRGAGGFQSGGFNTGGFDTSGFGGARTASRKGQDVEHEVTISLDEAFHGTTRALQWEDGRSIQAHIPRGVRTGSRVRLSGQGAQGSGGAASGDLYLKVRVRPHPNFEREGDDLRVDVPVDLYTALLGGSVPVASMDRTVNLTIPEGTQNGQTFRLGGLGMPNLRNPDERGDLYAVVDVQLPENLTDEERRLFEQLQAKRR